MLCMRVSAVHSRDGEFLLSRAGSEAMRLVDIAVNATRVFAPSSFSGPQ